MPCSSVILLPLLKVLSKCSHHLSSDSEASKCHYFLCSPNSNFNTTIYTKPIQKHVTHVFLFSFSTPSSSFSTQIKQVKQRGQRVLRGRYRTQPVPCPLVLLFMPEIWLSTVCMTLCRPEDSAMSKTYCSLIGQSLQSSGRDKYIKNYYRRKTYSNCYQREERKRGRRGGRG